MRLVFATHNRGKLKELSQLLSLDGVELLSLDDLKGIPRIEETGETFSENAELKARVVMEATGLPALADDSGLEVDAIDGAPGVRSARYAGPGASDAERIYLLLRNLEGVPPEKRTARFRCVVAFIDPLDPDRVRLQEGSCEGLILDKPRGKGGFGYDPVFYVEELGQTFAEASPEAKNRLSHRGEAMHKMMEELRQYLGARKEQEQGQEEQERGGARGE
jgi:XTP/dITP diphosphohydrolase